ncbi:NADPH:quinone oxidoreductase family protein [Polycladomyces subterraneus]|uniref:NADPH:quinone oxidoreductase family protein n=1 Tax=Polycladomyces subterraneus TaxID=1016997 RepID=A0ABT8IRT9_9BACL|nr:NADPH:quinone oxidoreductase family protein [Polycladomyces subterraneus]MDN4595171.1 NADPH:quinone oxidoreductase family protein [Polycladomyces subterraneus]
MRAWVVKELGEVREVLRLQDVPMPKVLPGTVLIRVEAASLNFFDILLCKGKYQEKPPLPFTPGAEIAGTIEKTGAGVSLKTGQRVFALPQLPAGGFAEWVVVPEEAVYPIPEEVPATEAAAMFITYQTSYYALHRCARLQPNEVLLVHAGAGGVGSAAIQLGVAAGARVIATAGGPEKVHICRELGAEAAIDYRTENFVEVVKTLTNGRGADVIFDSVGGDVFDLSRKCIAFEGRLLVIGFAGGRIAEAPTNHALVKNYSIVGVHWGLFRRLMPEKVREAHEQLMSLYQAGHIRPLIFKQFSFEELPDALELLQGRKTWGKLVVTP